MYKVIALIGQAGSGKDYLLKKVIDNSKDFSKIVSYTTRPKREKEKDEVDYFFLDKDTYIKKIKKGEMIEGTSFKNWYYGTSLNALKHNKINIGIFNPYSIKYLLSNNLIDLTIYYIQASDKERLLRQLTREDNPNVEEIVRRYSADKRDFDELKNFEYIELKNDNLDDLEKNLKLILEKHTI